MPELKVYEITVKNAGEPGLVEFKPTAEDESLAAAEDLQNISTMGHGLNPASSKTKTATTNTVSSAAVKKSPPFDPMLDETEHILLDYISLLPKTGTVTATSR